MKDNFIKATLHSLSLCGIFTLQAHARFLMEEAFADISADEVTSREENGVAEMESDETPKSVDGELLARRGGSKLF